MRSWSTRPRARRASMAARGRAAGALLALASMACVGTMVPVGEPLDDATASVAAPAPPALNVRPARRPVLVGQMCPGAAAGQPAMVPLFLREAGWSAAPEDVLAPLRSQAARTFAVLAWDGRRAGVFSPVGVADGGGREIGIGSYAGAPPCQRPRTGAGDPVVDPACVGALRGCGLAVAALEPGSGFDARPYAEDGEPLPLRPGAACAADGKLLVDLDGDGRSEAFDAAQFATADGQPADEVAAVAVGESACDARFAVAGLPVGAAAGAVDLLAVLDLDQDGRRELVLSFDAATWAVYAATATPGRLDLVARARPLEPRQ